MPQGLAITGLLVASITVVAVVDVDVQPEFACQSHGAVPAAIVHQNPSVDTFGNLGNRSTKGPLRIVGGQHDGDVLAMQHA